MADVKFSELTSLAASDVAAADIFAVVDTSASTSKKLTVDNLFGAIPVNIAVTDTTDSSSNTTGSITTTGGVGISKNLYVGEDVFIFGNTTIGGASSDTVAITADVASDIIPDGDGTRDLGDGSNQFSNLFVNNITTTAFTANSTSILIAGTDKLFFQDTGTNIQSPTDGTLDIAADTILEVTAPTTNVIASTALTIHTPAISANGTLTIGADDTGFDINFHTATANKRWFLDESEDTMFANVTSVFGGDITVGVDGAGHDVTLFGDTASSQILFDQSDDQLEFGNSFITMSDTRTSGTTDVRGITIDISNKVDTGSSNDRIGIDCDVIGDVNGFTIRDAVAIRAVSRQSTGAEVVRLNTPIHAVLDLANTTAANNTGTTLSGAYGIAIDHDDTIATRTGQPTAFISFGELYTGGTESIETKYLFDIFPEGKTGDATYGTAADVAFYNDGAQYASTRDTMLLNSTDGAPGSDAGDHVMMEQDPFDSIQMDDNFMLETEDGEAILLEVQDNVGTSSFILFETGSQDADGVLKIRVNGEDKYIQLYNLVS